MGEAEQGCRRICAGLGSVGKAVSLLLKAVSDSDGKIAAAAVKSLTRIKNAKYAGVSSKTAAKAENILSLVVIKNKGGIYGKIYSSYYPGFNSACHIRGRHNKAEY